jgi:undecaprenyl diphosphate synthase
MDQIRVPKHIAFIMDGNGRWAKKRGLPRKFGHKEGVKALQKIIEGCKNRGVEICSFYAFSTENWKRPQEEIEEIFSLVEKFAKEELSKYVDKGYRVTYMGDITKLPENTQSALKEIKEKGSSNSGMIVNIAINYGGRDEIVRAVNKVLQSGIKQIDEQMLSDCMYTAGIPDPDIIVRTSGEERLSNFMLWQSAYSELLFIDDLWPDVNEKTVDYIIECYSKRNRRFGGK